MCAPVLGKVVSLQGTVETQRAGSQAWVRVARLDTPVCEGDRLRAGPASRAAIFVQPENLIRLDQNTELTVSHTPEETFIEFFQDPTAAAPSVAAGCGAGYVITRFPKKFRIRTPHVNAAVEGTEFLVAMRCEATELAVFEGKVRAQAISTREEQTLTSGQVLAAGLTEPSAIRLLVKPTDAVQWALYYPPLSDASVAAQFPSSSDCLQLPDGLKQVCYSQRAEQLLRLGRVDEAESEIAQALAESPTNGDVLAVRAVISVVKNDREGAHSAAQKAVEVSPNSSRAWLALSYAQQAQFKLDDALKSVQRAAQISPDSSLVQARLAELFMSLGRTKDAEKAARRAVEANPNEERAYTVLGFVHLAQIQVKEAQIDFQNAIERDSTAPLPRLGLGLAIIRQGQLIPGREQLEIAVALDPTNSLLRSYVGKAYYEENTRERDQLAATQFDLAKQLDPNDPTPWFYGAMLKQTQNSSVDALMDLHKSRELNDGRAVYRSRLLLDEDLASRSATTARLYEDLGIGQRALVEATQSLSVDPTNVAAHRFLAEAYSQEPRSESARESELLQTRLREPLARIPLDPLSPQRNPSAFTVQTGRLAGTDSARASINEYSPLFERDGASLYVDALAADYGTYSEQLAVSGIRGPLGLNVAQGHLQTDGMRPDANLTQDAYEALLQLAPTADLSVETEIYYGHVRRREVEFDFDPSNATTKDLDDRFHRARLGGRYSISAESELLFYGGYQTTASDLTYPAFPGFEDAVDFHSAGSEIQYSFVKRPISLTAGAGSVRSKTYFGLDGTALPSSHQNAYLYTQLAPALSIVKVQLALSMDSLDRSVENFTRQEVNPKFGLLLSPAQGTTIRLVALKHVKRELMSNQTLEPTQVAGFSQIYEDPNGAIVFQRGAALDQDISPNVTAGFGIVKRELDVPLLFGTAGTVDYRWDELSRTAYLHFAVPKAVTEDILRGLSANFTAEYYNLNLDRPADLNDANGVVTLDTWQLPLGVSLLLRQWAVRLESVYVKQSGILQAFPGEPQFPVEESFWVTNASVALILPKRLGRIRFGAANLFDQSSSYREIDPAVPQFSPRRFIYGSLSLQF